MEVNNFRHRIWQSTSYLHKVSTSICWTIWDDLNLIIDNTHEGRNLYLCIFIWRVVLISICPSFISTNLINWKYFCIYSNWSWTYLIISVCRACHRRYCHQTCRWRSAPTANVNISRRQNILTCSNKILRKIIYERIIA